MKIQIDNQIIEITGGSTFITVVNTVQNFRHKLNFDFKNYPNESEKIKRQNRAEYYWLNNLYDEFIKLKPGTQLKLTL